MTRPAIEEMDAMLDEPSHNDHRIPDSRVIELLRWIEQQHKLAQTLVDVLDAASRRNHDNECFVDDDGRYEGCGTIECSTDQAALALAATHNITPGGKK